MSLIDRVVAAVTPMESEESRRQARAKARAAAGTDDWLALILQHHEAIESAFAAVQAAPDMSSRMVAMRHLAVLLTGHSNAEESVIYPALVRSGHKSHAMMGYTEQAGAKANMGELEYLDPMSKDFMDKLEHVRGAVAHHMYEEENDRFLDLKQLPAADQERLTQRFREEFDRYMKAGDKTSLDMTEGLQSTSATNPAGARPGARPPHAPVP
jgi:hemerythrin HHE cation binding domain-containing protein